VVISQDLDELLELCDTLAVINGGRLSRAMAVAGVDINEIGLLMGGIHGDAETTRHAAEERAHHAA
jgi:ABC-type sugar transport system ATPase subunit